VKPYRSGSNPSIRVPVRDLLLSNGERMRLYDTRGPRATRMHRFRSWSPISYHGLILWRLPLPQRAAGALASPGGLVR